MSLEPSAGGAAVLDGAAEHLRGVRADLPLDGAKAAAAEARGAADQIADHLAPRLASLDAPLLIVVGGSTGAGKSTLVNALVGRPATRAGAIRPTTRRPVLLHNPEDRAWFEGGRILPGLARVRGEQGAVPPEEAPAGEDGEHQAAATSLALVSEPAIPRGMALLDAPDIDSVSRGNRELARQLLRAADLWLFVTTANRYADAVPWEVLRSAAARDIPVAVVMNRIPDRPGIAEELSEDLRSLLARDGLEEARLLLVHETEVDGQGMISGQGIDEVRGWIDALASDADARGSIARRTLAGALGALAGGIGSVADELDAQAEERARLGRIVDASFGRAEDQIEQALGDGSLLRGEVLSRWQDVVGTSDLFRSVDRLFGRLRDGAGRLLSGKPAPSEAAEDALGSSLGHLVVEGAARAIDETRAQWRASASGRSVLEHGAEGSAPLALPRDFSEQVDAAIRMWQAEVLELVRTEGADRRTRARVLSLGVNVVGVALMVVVFASTAFIPTGLEVGTGAAAAVVGQKLLETIFGDDAVRRLAKSARERLDAKVEGLLDEVAAPFRARLDALAAGTSADELRDDARSIRGLAEEVR